MKIRKRGGAVAAGIVMSLVACTRYSVQDDPSAKEAVLALKKLRAKTEIGMSYRDYSVALGDANFPVQLFLEGDKASLVPHFSDSLRKSLKWFEAAAELWAGQIEAGQPTGYCAEIGATLCAAYPELRTGVSGVDDHEVPAIIYELARQESWKRGEFELKNADHAYKSEPLERADDRVFKIDKNAEQLYLFREAKKSLLGHY
jgi:hypothetical protein